MPPCLSGVMGLGSLLIELHQAVLWKMAFHVLWMVEKQRKATRGAEDALRPLPGSKAKCNWEGRPAQWPIAVTKTQ